MIVFWIVLFVVIFYIENYLPPEDFLNNIKLIKISQMEQNMIYDIPFT